MIDEELDRLFDYYNVSTSAKYTLTPTDDFKAKLKKLIQEAVDKARIDELERMMNDHIVSTDCIPHLQTRINQLKETPYER